MSDIPLELFREILLWVPAEPLLCFRRVCKAWLHTIDDRSFRKLHLHCQLLKIQDSSNGVGQLILRGDDNWLYSLPLEHLKPDGSKNVKAFPLKANELWSYGEAERLVGSCNGFMLTSLSEGENLLWNPLTRESHRLPPPMVMMEQSTGLYHGLGYDFAADDCKVVNIVQVFDPRHRSLESKTFIYSLKLDSWRMIKDFPYRIWLTGGIFLKGALHWIANTMPHKFMDDLIIGLDLASEDYCLLPLPSELSGSGKPSAKQLGVLDGCLILSCYYRTERLDVWLMKDYGVENSWIRLFSVAALNFIGAVETLRPIAYSKSKGQVLLEHNKKEFLWFNLETKLWKKIKIDGHPFTFSSQLCLTSLVRLKAVIGDRGSNNAEGPAR